MIGPCLRHATSCPTLVFSSAPLLRNHARYGRAAHGAPRLDNKTAPQSLGVFVHVLEAATVLRIVGGEPYSVIRHDSCSSSSPHARSIATLLASAWR